MVSVMILPIIVVLIVLLVSKEIHHGLFWFEHKSQIELVLEFHYLLARKIEIMEADDFTTDSDWRNLLPICEYADNWYKELNPGMEFETKREYVLELMA